MPRELLIAAGPGEWRAALLEQSRAVELYVERGDTRPPGSLHLGRVVQVVRGLDAALVDIGEERPGFLPLRDVPPGASAQEGARIIVQVRREAHGDKATRLTGRVAGLAALSERAAALAPPAQIEPAPGLMPALRLRLPAMPDRIVCDEPAIVPELRAGFRDAEVESRNPMDWPIDLDAAFDAGLSPQVALTRGGTLHIEEARAATLIDVDTGTPPDGSSARAALAANLEAADRIARELRLRNIGGGIVVDFVGLDGRGPRERVSRALADALAADPAKPQLLGWTRLGHVEIVRPRRGRSLADAMLEAGWAARQPFATACAALRRVQREARARPAAAWRLAVPPAVEAALHAQAAPALRALETRLGRPIVLAVDPALPRDGFDIAAL
jgi:Ribonuclease G/E